MNKRYLLPWIPLILAAGMAQSFAQASSSSARPVGPRVYVNGKLIAAKRVVVKDGVSYVDATALAEALGAVVQSAKASVIITSSQPNQECDKSLPDGQRFSEEFRSDVVTVPDEIESLRAVVMKKDKSQLGPRFDALDRKLALSTTHVQTEADSAVYYALTFASNSLAIAYYKQSRGVGFEEAQKDQLDSMICAMESKFALMKGVLLPGGTCSVFQRMESQPAQAIQTKQQTQ